MSSSDEDPESPAVPPGLFNDRKDSVSMDVDEPTESYDTPPGLFDEVVIWNVNEMQESERLNS